MMDEKLAIEELFHRVERDGVGVVTVSDGQVFVFTLEILERLVEDARGSASKKVSVFIRRAVETA